MSRHGRHDEDYGGVRVTVHPRRSGSHTSWLVLLAILIAGVAGWKWLERRSQTARLPEPSVSRDRGAAASPSGGGVRSGPVRDGVRPRSKTGLPQRTVPVTHRGVDGEDPTHDLSDYVLPGEAPAMEQVIAALHARGIRTGLGAFQPPGTSPPLRGLEVPADFPLPEGYVRHHQATDDGQQMRPILMFAPDLEAIVIRGQRVRIPVDRVVTPELAPPGMPLRWVRIPPPVGGRR